MGNSSSEQKITITNHKTLTSTMRIDVCPPSSARREKKTCCNCNSFSLHLFLFLFCFFFVVVLKSIGESRTTMRELSTTYVTRRDDIYSYCVIFMHPSATTQTHVAIDVPANQPGDQNLPPHALLTPSYHTPCRARSSPRGLLGTYGEMNRPLAESRRNWVFACSPSTEP